MGNLRSKTGCSNCRARKKKCDETRPICRACFKLALLCDFVDRPEISTSDRQVSDTTRSMVMDASIADSGTRRGAQRGKVFALSYTFRPIEHRASICPESADIGDFHRMDIADHERTLALARVHRMVDLNIKHMWPFVPEGGLLTNVRASWLVPILRHGIFINGVIAISAGIESNAGKEPYWQNMRQRYEARTVSFLRANLSDEWIKKSYVSQYQLMCASCHLVWLNATYECDGPTMRQLANGSRYLVEQSGGLRVLWELGRRPELETLVRCEWLASLVNADEPGYLTDCTRPDLVPALTISAGLQTLHDAIIHSCSPDAVAVTRDLRLLLYHRYSSEQSNTCPTLSSLYCLTDLLNYVDMQLCTLQRRYLGTASITECFVFGLILMRTEVFEDGSIFPRLSGMICSRFYQAMSATSLHAWFDTDNAMTLRMWLLCIGLLTVRDTTNRDFFIRELAALLNYVVRPQEDSDACLLDALHTLQIICDSFLWHGRLYDPFRQLCKSLVHSQDRGFAFIVSTSGNTCIVDREAYMDPPV